MGGAYILAAQHGVELLDAPVSGCSRMRAEAGQLSFLVGGKDTVLEAAAPVLKAMVKSSFILAPLEVEQR